MEFVGTVQFKYDGARGNPVALYMEQVEGEYRISARLPQWRHIVGTGATVNKAAGNYEVRLKAAVPAEDAYEGPYWNAGIKAEKPALPKPSGAPAAPAAPVPASPAAPSAGDAPSSA